MEKNILGILKIEVSLKKMIEETTTPIKSGVSKFGLGITFHVELQTLTVMVVLKHIIFWLGRHTQNCVIKLIMALHYAMLITHVLEQKRND